LAEEQPRLLPLPAHPFPTALVKTVRSGKTPYIRFDRNWYSIPHTLVQQPLILVADAETVRFCDETETVAEHLRCYDADFTVEAREHLAGLIAAKRQASGLTRRDRLRRAVPAVGPLLERLAVRGEPLGPQVNRLLRLLDEYGPAELAAAVAIALTREAPGAGGIAHLLEQRRRARGQRPPVPVTLPDDPRVRDLDVTPHPLERYDDLTRIGSDNPDSDSAPDADPA
jgi:hypothetical protein